MSDRPDREDESPKPSRRKAPAGKKSGAAGRSPTDPYRSVPLLRGRTRRFDTEDGGVLRVDPGEIALAFRLRRNPDPRQGEPIDTASCLLRLADDAGEVWEAVSTFSLHAFIEKMVDLDRSSWLAFFDDVEEWKEAFAGDCLMSGATCLLDDRSYRKFLVGDERVELRFKYQCPTFDVAFYLDPHARDLTHLIVRASGLYDLEANEIRPLAFEMSWWDLIFRNELYFDEEEGWWMGDSWPLPLAFERVGCQGEPQPLVRYETGPTEEAKAGPC